MITELSTVAAGVGSLVAAGVGRKDAPSKRKLECKEITTIYFATCDLRKSFKTGGKDW